ncbi:NAD-P-binding protein [Dentipellis sp. KUC8613]|nr:NAD-P-binding protein [Dentipellis sp. KUC8613]
MSTFTTFALAGVGNIGSFIANDFLARKAAGQVKRVVILTRSSTDDEKNKKFERKGAEVITIDYSSKASLISALSGIEVVISTINLGALDSQFALIDAAKDAGVKLFVPSEFGTPTDDIMNGPRSPKRKAKEQLKKLDLPYVLVYTGAFSDTIFSAKIGLDPASGKVTVGGDGSATVSFTSRPDIARYAGYVLTGFSAQKLEWRKFQIEGDRLSFNEVFEKYSAKTGNKVEVSYRSIAELEEAVEKNPGDVKSRLLLIFAHGDGIVGKKEDVTNGEFPGWHPKTVLDILAP